MWALQLIAKSLLPPHQPSLRSDEPQSHFSAKCHSGNSEVNLQCKGTARDVNSVIVIVVIKVQRNVTSVTTSYDQTPMLLKRQKGNRSLLPAPSHRHSKHLLSVTLRQDAWERKNISLWGVASVCAHPPERGSVCFCKCTCVCVKRGKAATKEREVKQGSVLDITNHRVVFVKQTALLCFLTLLVILCLYFRLWENKPTFQSVILQRTSTGWILW